MKAVYEVTSEKRLTALLILAAFLMVMLFSSCYVVMEAGHECSGAACEICAMIVQCGNNLIRHGTGQLTTVTAAVCCFLYALLSAVSAITAETPIACKVRLNN